MQKTFLNLTNGIEFLTKDDHFDGFIRIQSSHCESKKFDYVIQELDSNFLMYLAMGYKINVVDYSAKKASPRALYQGLEWIWFACCKAWNLPIEEAWVRTTNCIKYFDHVYRNLPVHIVRKLKYFSRFANSNQIHKPTTLTGKTDHDGDYDFYVKVVDDYISAQN